MYSFEHYENFKELLTEYLLDQNAIHHKTKVVRVLFLELSGDYVATLSNGNTKSINAIALFGFIYSKLKTNKQ